MVDFGGVDIEEESGWTRSTSLSPSYLLPRHDMQLKRIEFHILVRSFSLHWATRCRGREGSAFGSRLGSTTLSHRTLYLRRTEKPGSGNDHVQFVCAEQAIGRERGFGGVEKELMGAAEDEA